MIIITPARFRFLKTGRPTRIPHPQPDRYKPHRDYAVGYNHRHQLCRVDILEIGDKWLRVQLAADLPRLLAAYSQYGYTDNPARAMREEPEAVDIYTLEQYARQANERREIMCADEIAWQRLKSVAIQAKEVARRQDAQAFEELRSHLLEVAAMRSTAGTAVAA